MANINIIEDTKGELIDLEYFCSDRCAKGSPNYNGWYGCVEIYTPEYCQNCETMLTYVKDD